MVLRSSNSQCVLLNSQLSSATSPFYFATAFTCKFTKNDISHLHKSPCSSKQRHISCVLSCLFHHVKQHHSLVDPPRIFQAVHQAACRDKKEMNPVATRGITNSMGMKKPAKGMKRRKPGRYGISITSYIHIYPAIFFDISSSKPPFSSGISQPRLLTRDPFVKKTRVDWWICVNKTMY